MDNDILQALKEIQQSQTEMMTWLQAEAQKAERIRDEAMALQRQAVARVKRISLFAFPAVIMCIVLLVYLIVKYRIL